MGAPAPWGGAVDPIAVVDARQAQRHTESACGNGAVRAHVNASIVDLDRRPKLLHARAVAGCATADTLIAWMLEHTRLRHFEIRSEIRSSVGRYI